MNKTPFRKLKTALLILSSNYSTVMQEIKNSKEPYYTRRIDVSSWRDNKVLFKVLIENDFLPEVRLSKENDVFVIQYDSMTYNFSESSIAFYDKKLKSVAVDISDIESNADLFSLSTVRDFYDLSYNDIVTLKEFILDCNKIYGIQKHV